MSEMLSFIRYLTVGLALLACGPLVAQEKNTGGLVLDLSGTAVNGAEWGQFLDEMCAKAMALGEDIREGALLSSVKEKDRLLAAAAAGDSTSIPLSPTTVPPGGAASKLLVQLDSGKLNGAMLVLGGPAMQEAALAIAQWFSQRTGELECGVTESKSETVSATLRGKEERGSRWVVSLRPDLLGTGRTSIVLTHMLVDAPPPFAQLEILPLSKLEKERAMRLYTAVGLTLRATAVQPDQPSAPAAGSAPPEVSTVKVVELVNAVGKGLSVQELSQLRPKVEKDDLMPDRVPVSELRQGVHSLLDPGPDDLLPDHHQVVHFTVQDGKIADAVIILVSWLWLSRGPFVAVFEAIAEDWALNKVTLAAGDEEKKEGPFPLLVFAPAEAGAPPAYLALQYKDGPAATCVMIVVQTKNWASYGELITPVDASPEAVAEVFRQYGFDYEAFAKRLDR